MANFTGDRKTVGQILSLASPPIEVPQWQRNFSWGPDEIETFWSDLISFSDLFPDDNIIDQEYFLGSIVLVNRGSNHRLLDGQQRLATSTILLSVIRDFQSKHHPEAGLSLSQKFSVEPDYAANRKSFKLTMSHYDREFFGERSRMFETEVGQVRMPTCCPTRKYETRGIISLNNSRSNTKQLPTRLMRSNGLSEYKGWLQTTFRSSQLKQATKTAPRWCLKL